jgi:5,10-methylene-tetrahydrofolate dehydrogenase/methenyl tetrahydrofolate cyclohydrolase
MTREITQDLREVKQACNREQKYKNMQLIQKIKSQVESIAQEEEKKGGLPVVQRRGKPITPLFYINEKAKTFKQYNFENQQITQKVINTKSGKLP